MSHYFCSECGGVSEASGVCQTEGCSKKGHQLQECDCGDISSHKGMSSVDQEKDSKSSEESDEEGMNGIEF